ncbi:MAG: hypothetical protein WCX65_04790 [bacterium]
MLDSGMPITAPPWYPPSLDQQVRTTAQFGQVTYYLPTPESWYLFDGTAQYTWISAIGTTAGISASMTNPFKEVGVMFFPKGRYNNNGQVTFYVDGVQVGTLNLAAEMPYEGYSDEYVSYYRIASNLPETTHTVTMVIASGTVAFDGWRMIYHNQQYNIDCSEANTLESDTISEVDKLRDGIEAYAEEYSGYPNTASFNSLISYLQTSGATFPEIPTNPFTGDDMTDSATYSAGNFHYVSTATSSYSLKAYGGSGTLISMTENSVETTLMSLSLTSPPDHFATTAAYVTFSGAADDNGTDDWGAAYMSICCGLSGETQFPATGTFNVRIYLREGVNNIVAKLSDPFGNQISLKRTISKDTTAPSIMLIDPFPLIGPVGAQYYPTNSTPVTVRASVEKNSTATLNGAAMTVDSLGVFTTSLDLIPGNNVITIVASDNFNNTSSASYLIIYTP